MWFYLKLMCSCIKVKAQSKIFTPLGLSTLLFAMFTLSPNFSSIIFVRFPITYLQTFRFNHKNAVLYVSNRISSSLLYFLVQFIQHEACKKWRQVPSCGVPITDTLYSISTMIPLTRNFLTIKITSPSLIIFRLR